MSTTTMARQTLLPETYANLVLPAAIQDMEFRSNLPAARHYLENLLAVFSAAVCTTDTAKLVQLLQGVDIRIDGRELQPGQGPQQVISQFSPKGHPSLVVTNNLGLDLLTIRDGKIVEVRLFSADGPAEDAFGGTRLSHLQVNGHATEIISCTSLLVPPVMTAHQKISC